MTTEAFVKDIGEIYTRIFDHRPFLNGEIKFFLKEFEEKRNDKEVENLFCAVQTTTELKSNTYDKCRAISETNLPALKDNLQKTLTLCEKVSSLKEDPGLIATLEKNRETRKKEWELFIDDMTHKCSRIDLTFEQKEEELCEFYSDLEQKLHIHN